MKRKLNAQVGLAMLMGFYTKKTATILLIALLLIVSSNVSAQDCSCVNSSSNLLTNGSFENEHEEEEEEEEENGWQVSGGSLSTGTGYVVCGVRNGFLNWSSGTAKIWQQKAAQAGYTYTFKAYAGTHTPGLVCNPKISLIFLNAAGGIISQTSVAVTKDVDVTGNILALYTLSAVAPVGTVTVRPEASITCNTLKLDALCLTVSIPPVDCGCVNSPSNLLSNPSFENGSTGWTTNGGSLSTGTGYVMCGNANGFLNWATGNAIVYQDKPVAQGSSVTFKGYAGTHTPGISCNPKLSLIYFNSMGAVISQSDAIVSKDVDVTGPSLTQYTLSGTAPAGTVKVRVQGSITCNTLKVDAFCLTVTEGGTLPIRLHDFTASKQNKSVDLNWQTFNEQNSSHFDVEFSRDGGKFESIGKVKASVSSTTLKNYSLKHLSPVNGLNYYRLKMVDIDASSKYSAVRTVKFSKLTSIAVMPNPTTDRVYITSNEGGILQSVGLYTMSGKLLQQINNFTLGKSIDLSTYSPSVYILKLIDKNGSTEVIKIERK